MENIISFSEPQESFLFPKLYIKHSEIEQWANFKLTSLNKLPKVFS